jgi:hypothetical protein
MELTCRLQARHLFPGNLDRLLEILDVENPLIGLFDLPSEPVSIFQNHLVG